MVLGLFRRAASERREASPKKATTRASPRKTKKDDNASNRRRRFSFGRDASVRRNSGAHSMAASVVSKVPMTVDDVSSSSSIESLEKTKTILVEPRQVKPTVIVTTRTIETNDQAVSSVITAQSEEVTPKKISQRSTAFVWTVMILWSVISTMGVLGLAATLGKLAQVNVQSLQNAMCAPVLPGTTLSVNESPQTLKGPWWLSKPVFVCGSQQLQLQNNRVRLVDANDQAVWEVKTKGAAEVRVEADRVVVQTGTKTVQHEVSWAIEG